MIRLLRSMNHRLRMVVICLMMVGSGIAALVLMPNSRVLAQQQGSPTVQFTVSSQVVSETDGTVTFTVQLSAPSTDTVTVQFATVDGDAVDPTDYTATSGTLVFKPGETTQTITVKIINNNGTRGPRQASIVLSNPTNAKLGDITKAIFYIAKPPTVQFDSASYSVSESGGQVTITVTLSAPASWPVTVNYATADGTDANAAIDGIDYVGAFDTLTFAPGEIAKAFVVPILDTGTPGHNKTATISLSAPYCAILGPTSTTVLTIIDDDPPPPLPSVQFDSSSYSASECGGQALITVTLSTPASGQITVNYTTSDGSGANAAIAGTDYTTTSGTLTFNAGDTSTTFMVPLIYSGVSGPNKSANLTLSSPSGATLGSPATVVLTIIEDAPPPPAPPTVQFASASYVVSETQETQAIIVVNLSGPTPVAVNVDYATSDGTAIAGTDYTTTTGTLTIAMGTTSGTFTVPIFNPQVSGTSKTLTLTLSNPSGATPGSPSTSTLSIMDDYMPPPASQPTDVTVTTTDGTFSPSPAAVGDFVDATLSAQAVRPSSSTLSSPSWNWQYVGLQSNAQSPSGPWNSATATAFSIFSASAPSFDGTYDYSAVTVSTSFPAGAYYQMTFESQVNYTDTSPCLFFGKKRCKCQGIIVGVDKIIVQNSNPQDTGPTDMWAADSLALQVLPVPANAAWPAGWPLWTVPTKPNGSAIAPGGTPSPTATATPDLKGSYTIQAACGGSTTPFGITAHVVSIQKDAAALPAPPVTVIVGQQIVLSATVDPPVAGVTYLWANPIPGSNVKTYIQTLAAGTKTSLAAPGDFNKAAMTPFFWIDKMDPAQNVSVTATLNGKTKSVSAPFKVLRPTINETNTGTLTKNSPTISNLNTVKGLAIGQVVTSPTAGIPANTTITAINVGANSATMSANFTGTTTAGATISVFGFTSVTTTNMPAVDAAGGSLHFGTAGSPGITWTGTVTTPDGGAGTLGFVQRLNTDDRITLDDGVGTMQIRSSGGTFVLDRSGPPGSPVFYSSRTTAIGNSATATHGPLSDSPQLGFGGRKKISGNDKFETYLMYRPNAGTANKNIYVTLGKLDWNWKGATTKAAGVWTIDAGSTASSADAPGNPVGQDVAVLPEWTQRWMSLSFAVQSAVTPSNANLAQNATKIVINGTGFNATAANNTVTFNLGATGTVTAATATQLTVTFTTQPTALGNLTVVVSSTNPFNNSGAPVQVATVVAP